MQTLYKEKEIDEFKRNLDISEGGIDPKFFDPQIFSRNAKIVISKLEKHLADTSIKGLSLMEPSVLLEKAKKLMDDKKDNSYSFDEDKFCKIIDLYLSTGIQVQSPGYMGRQFSSVIPLAGLFDFVNSIVNQPASFYECGQLPNVAEHIMADEFNKFIGWPKDKFTMITTSGGSLATLTALLAARNDKIADVWNKGLTTLNSSVLPAIAVSEDAHYSISRAAGIMGIGSNQIVKLPVNDKRQICIEKVRSTIEEAEKKGLKIFCMVASAGNTSVGAFDPIDELADIANEKNIWFHVDGAHGGSVIVSDKLRYKLKGIEKVDSFSIDAHKMMFVPSMCSLLFYKNKEKAYGAFQQEASYVFDKDEDVYSKFDCAKKNFECTKRPTIMNLWVVWSLYGRSIFADKIEHLCNMANKAYEILENEDDFETINKPEANILCFKYRPSNLPKEYYEDFQDNIRKEVKRRGKFFISKVDINGEPVLRVVFMNHMINSEHFKMLLAEVRNVGQRLINKI